MIELETMKLGGGITEHALKCEKNGSVPVKIRKTVDLTKWYQIAELFQTNEQLPTLKY